MTRIVTVFRTTAMLILFFSIFTMTATAQKAANDYPVSKKISKAKIQRAFQSHTLFNAAQRDVRAQETLNDELKDGLLVDLDQDAIRHLRQEDPDALSLTLPLPKQETVEVDLVRNKVLTPDFILRQSSNPDQPVAYTPGLYYTGTVKGRANTLVAISVFENEIIGMISSPEDNFVIGKLNNRSAQHVIYNDNDLVNPSTLDCSMDDDGVTYKNEDLTFDMSRAVGDCVRVYLEIDDDIVTNKGGVTGATNYITGAMNQVITLYANDNLTMSVSEILAWDTPAPYSGGDSGAMLDSYQANTGAFNGDLSHLVSYQASGGIAAGFSGICNSNVDNSKCFSSIGSSYAQVPNYSYTIMVMTHEMGHLIGSRHTHACVWNGNGTAIDGCAGFVEGGCPLPGSPPNGGTIMSYCHVATGIDFTQGFGPQPQAVLLNTIANATCLSGCAGPTCDDGVQNGDETGVDCGGSSCPACETGCDDNDVFVNITLDNYPEETSWQVTDAGGAVVASGGTYPNEPDGSSISIPVCVVDGCYDFTINDSYGDGICCAYGNGSYSVTDADGNVLASGGEFTSSETTNFCFGGGSTPVEASATATDETCLGENDGTATATGSGGSGSYTYNWSNGGTTMTITGLAPGTYNVTVSDGTTSAVANATVLAGPSSTFYADTDGDGFGDNNNTTQACTAPAGYVSNNTDCDDGNNTVYPGATEICDGLDNNCNGQTDEGATSTYYADADGDGYGDNGNSVEACSAPAGYVSDNGDCNDGNNAVNPGATEVCDGTDNNCNGQTDEGLTNTYYADNDGDGFGDNNNSTEACSAPTGYVTDNTDCNDNDGNIYIGATCDDGNANTENDVYGSDCVCAGTPVSGCTDNGVTLVLLLDNYASETSWTVTDDNGATLYNGGTYPGQNGQTITEEFCLPDGCYDFTINDSYGDGICCAYGEGNYTVTDSNGNVLASGGEFTSSETTNFCFGDGGEELVYCESSGNNTSYEWIESVSIGNVNNTSGDNNGYGDFSGFVINGNVGGNVALSITPGFGQGTYNEYFTVWVDFNGDADFEDAGEEVFATSSNQTVSGSFTIPSNAVTANVGVRVTMKYGSAAAPCGSFTYGEVEDYTMSISNTQGFVQQDNGNDQAARRDAQLSENRPMTLDLFPNPVQNVLNISAQLSNNSTTVITITDIRGSKVMEQNIEATADRILRTQVDVSDLNGGIYMLRIWNGKEQVTKRFVKS